MVWLQPTEDYQPDSDELLAFPRKNGIRDATLLLLKEKSGRYGLLRVTYIISSHFLLLSTRKVTYYLTFTYSLNYTMYRETVVIVIK